MRKISFLLIGIVMSFTGFAQSWSLTGNAGTNPPTNFVGTTDNQRLVFKSNAVEGMTLLPSGNVGIGITTPSVLLHINTSVGDNNLALSGTAPSLRFFIGSTEGTQLTVGRLGLATSTNGFCGGSLAGDFIIQNIDSNRSILFATNLSGLGDGLERMRVNQIGYVGIGQPNVSARLDVQCTALAGQTNPSNIRFENLQSGAGAFLVIDNNGYVYRDTGNQAGAKVNNPLVTEMQNQIEEMRNQLDEMRSLLASRLALNQAEIKKLQNETAGYLGDVHPNPANSSTTIEYSLPAGSGAAFCQVYTLNGTTVATIALPTSPGKSQAQLNTSQLASGMYIYALVVDGKVLDTKKLAVVR
ncbi:MAG TPA: T9SS type A sorting domain-containing protein [Puia sp.]|jgi:hypothetical protein|nr:T9SS type A sorting domain-containing protein [Puia sp.]